MAGPPPLPNVVWLSIAQLFKQAIQGTHSFTSFIYQIRRRIICKWASFHGTIGGKNMWQGGSIWIQITILGLVIWLTMTIFRYSTIASGFLEAFFSCSGILELNLISSFHNIRSMKIPLESSMCVAQLASSLKDSIVEYQLHLVPNTWVWSSVFIPIA